MSLKSNPLKEYYSKGKRISIKQQRNIYGEEKKKKKKKKKKREKEKKIKKKRKKEKKQTQHFEKINNKNKI